MSAIQDRPTNSDPDATKRAEILYAAHQLFVRYGFKKTTMDDLAAEAGVGKGTIYYYFRSKKDLLLGYADMCLQEINVQVEEALTRPGHFVERLTRVMRAKFLGIYDHVHAGPHGEEIFHDLFPILFERHQEEICRTKQLLEQLIQDARGAGTVRVEDPAQASHLIHRAFQSFAPPYTPLTGTREEIDQDIEAMAHLVYEGLR